MPEYCHSAEEKQAMQYAFKAAIRVAVLSAASATVGGCVQSAAPQPGSASNFSGTTQSQGVNTHNSEPMQSGMIMRNNGLSQGSPMAFDPNIVPQSGSAGVNTHNSEPMPSNMPMQNNGIAPGKPLISDPSMVPKTSSSGVNTTNSEPVSVGVPGSSSQGSPSRN